MTQMYSLVRHASTILLATGLGGCRASTDGLPHESPAVSAKESVRLPPGGSPSPVQFKVAEAALGPALPLPSVTGRVTTVLTLTSPTFAPLPGRIASVSVRLGAKVNKGDRLVEVRAAELSTLRRDVETARLAVKTREALVQRLEQLVSSRIAAESDLLVARSELAESRLAATAASERIQALSVEPSGQTTYWLRATRAGTIVSLSATPGQHVAPEDGTALVVVADLAEVIVEADVPQRDAGEIRVGQTASIIVNEGAATNIEGRVESVSEVVDPARQVVPVRISVRNDPRTLRPNSFVHVIFSGADSQQMLVVPSAAVVSDGARSVVFIEVEPGVFRRRPVELGRRTRDLVEIKGGLSPIERIVTSGALLLLNALDVVD